MCCSETVIYTPITLDKDHTSISILENIGPECSNSLLDVHTMQYSQQWMGWDCYGRGQAWTTFEYVQNIGDKIVGFAERSKHQL